ncbi:ankyrin repeat protein [Histoplasma capsulatum var. duboisii H88]|uniref:Ankyrin repeat protein n=1 Tax=Ajellomyces capsulatus (strain H88) TaxID=544711 RepID=F0UD12_AJEC8|nr:ankyrin repeat protein [Histoplasma capsulatum var. duboisii H88]
MWPPNNSSSPIFRHPEPLIVDGDMEHLYGDGDMKCFDPSVLQASTPHEEDGFDDIFLRPSTATQPSNSTSCLSPARLIKAGHQRSSTKFPETQSPLSDTRSDSPEDSTHSSQSSRAGDRFSTPAWPSLVDFTVGDSSLFGQTNDIPPFNGDYPLDTDLETSNKAMSSAFDFDSAASSPSPLKVEIAPETNHKSQQPNNMLRGPSNTINQVIESNSPSTNFPTSASPFYFRGSSDASKPSAFRSKSQSGSNQWERQSPGSELEETFGSITMNGTASPLSSTLSPSLNFGVNPLNFDPMTQSSVSQLPTNGDTSAFHPNMSQENYDKPQLVVHPTSLKSRVETQIPIKLTLCPLPPGVKNLRLPSHAISKPKFLAKPDTGPSPEILELRTNVVCTSAMQDKKKLERAFARAREEELEDSSVESDSKKEGRPKEETPLEGGDVKICSGCVQRERKRASRKKQRKPEEDELFQRDEEKRVIVFNTTELKDWVQPTGTVTGSTESPSAVAPPGAMQVELPMRIACYCRHQNEKLGFQVIFTIKDHLGNTVSQTITNSIMITDDHKTHAPANPIPQNSTLPAGHQLPGAGVFPASANPSIAASLVAQPPFRLSHSSTDLQALRKNQFAFSREASSTLKNSQAHPPAVVPPRNLSRQASPTEFQGPSSKRRKQSGSGKLPVGLTMTKVENSRNAAATTNATVPKQSSQTSRKQQFNGQAERSFAIPASMTPQFGNGPPTPNNNDIAFFGPTDRPRSSDNLPQNQLISAPNSAQTSRPGSPGLGNHFQGPSNPPGSLVSSQMWGISPPNPPNRLPTMIHKLVPSEGSTTGGSEVTLLGSGFYPGMEVVFGDTLATTTTFWGDKCLNCLTPPALQPGTVPVVFKHEHPTFGQFQASTQPMIPKQPIFFRYVDDRELQMYRVALGILGQKLRNPADAFQTAQQIMGGGSSNMWNLQGNFQGNGQQGHGNQNSQANINDLDAKMLVYLEFMDLDDSPRSPRFNRRSPSGQTLLHYAASLGLIRFVAGLLARGANPNVQDNNGNSPLHLAALSGHIHIVHRLRLADANVAATNLRDFTPADLATSLETHQAVLVPARHYRSRSVGSTRSLRRRPSSASLDMSWEIWSDDSENIDVDSSDDSSDGSDESEPTGEASDSPFFYPASRRTSIHRDSNAGFYFSRPHESSAQPSRVQPPNDGETEGGDGSNVSSPARLIAWRNQLAAQINQFQQNVNWAFPNLPALPPMPTLPDYQTYPMMRRITSLVPQRPTTSWPTTVVKDSWDRLTGNSSPPAYEDLYPVDKTEEDYDLKKSSMVQAARDAAVDQHFEMISEGEASSASSISSPSDIGDVRIGRANIPHEQQEQLRQAHARKMKRIRSDRNLFFIWIPLLIVVVIAMLQNLVPDIWHGLSRGYQMFKARHPAQTQEIRMVPE